MTTINATSDLYLRGLGPGVIEYSLDNIVWSTIASWPTTITNTDTSTLLTVHFTTDLTLTGGTNRYFICGTEMIQFGDRTLKNDGTRPTVFISAIVNYLGLIENGKAAPFFLNGYNNIRICNLIVSAINGTTMDDYGGWIGRPAFARGAIDNSIVNCTTDGAIAQSGGGIVGYFAASNDNSNLVIRGCNSSGAIGPNAGGIVGYNSGNTDNTSLFVVESYSSGAIGNSGGGIFGASCGCNYNTVTVLANTCYSTGSIGADAGGIYGAYSGNSTGVAQVLNCYSTGAIEGGGIFGVSAGDGGETLATNTYSTGNILSGCGGIYAANYSNTARASNCYTSGASTGGVGGIWSGSSDDNLYGSNNYAEGNHSSSGWSDTNAAATLQFAPSGAQTAGGGWVTIGINQPYRFQEFSFTPYSLANINEFYFFPNLISQSIAQGDTTIASILPPGYTYTLIAIDTLNPIFNNTITINSATGQISTTTATPPGIYTIILQSEINPYSMSRFDLTVTGPAPTPTNTLVVTPCCQNPPFIRDSPTTNNSSEVITADKSGKTIIRNVNTYYDAIANKSVTYLAKPVFGSYREYMEYLQSNN